MQIDIKSLVLGAILGGCIVIYRRWVRKAFDRYQDEINKKLESKEEA